MIMSAPRSVAVIAATRLPARSANSLQVIRMCEALAETDWRVVLFAPAYTDTPPSAESIRSYYGLQADIEIRLIGWPAITKPDAFWAMACLDAADRAGCRLIFTRHLPSAALAKAHHWPVVYEAHKPAGTAAGQAARGYSLSRAVKAVRIASRLVIGRWRGSHNLASLGRLMSLIRHRGLVSNADFEARLACPAPRCHLIAITQRLADDLVARYPDLPGHISVLADGATRAGHDVTPAVLPGRPRGGRVGYCGHLYTGKGMSLIAELVTRCPTIDFHIVGGEPDDIAAWQAHLGTCENLYFHGHVGPHEVPGYLAAMDIALLPNQARVATAGDVHADIGRYTSPLKMFDYMAAGRAIVASDLAVLREVLIDGHNARLCPPDAPEAWAAMLGALIDAPAERRRLGDQARHDLESHYTWAARARALSCVFDRLSA